jgi:23S rRNA (cytosine1962-C5)-methyltransferase
LPGLVADVYGRVLVIKLYSFIWLPYLKDILELLKAASACETAVLRLSRNMQARPELLSGLSEGMLLYGELENPEVLFREHGWLFSANVLKGHKTGYFLDHRHNRKKVGEMAKGRRVLDIFSYAGGFTVHALGGGATEVISMDISAQAQEMAQKNVALNFKQANHRIMVTDAFEGMRQLIEQREQFGLVVVDPPSFAKRESERTTALNSYERLATLAVQLVGKGGILLLASCSSRVSAEAFFDVTERVLQRSKRPYREIERTYHDIDHPVTFPEGAYLKAVYYELN